MKLLIVDGGSKVFQLPKTFHLFLILILIFFISCTSNMDGQWVKLKVDTNIALSFKLDSLSSNYWPVSQLFKTEDGNEYLIHQNPFPTNPNRLFFSSLNSLEESFFLNFEVEGPKGVGGITDFYFYNFDSIFLIDRYSYRMSLVDSLGQLKMVYRLKENDGNEPDDSSVLPFSMDNRKIMKTGKFILIPVIPDVDPFESDYKLRNLILVVNIENGEMKKKIGFPRSYQGGFRGDLFHYIPSFSLIDDKNLIVSYPLTDSIFRINIDSDEIVPEFHSKSILMKGMTAADPSKWGDEESIRFQLAVPRHTSVIHDPYRKNYLRVSNSGFDDESVSEMIKRRPALRPSKSSMVIHEFSGKVIGRFIIDDEYNDSDILVLERGLFIALKSQLEDEKVYHKIIID
jgi:hypothetical protein